MKTDIITVSSQGSGMETALSQAAAVAAYKGLGHRQLLHLQLLTEEMMGMMRSITGATEGKFWIEDEDGTYQLHLQTSSRMNIEKREKLLSASTSGKNEAAKGLMGKLRDFFNLGSDDTVASLPALMMDGIYDASTTPMLDMEWSMSRYRDEVYSQSKRQEENALKAWDELEKSVVAHVADEVKVYISGDKAEMVIFKSFN